MSGTGPSLRAATRRSPMVLVGVGRLLPAALRLAVCLAVATTAACAQPPAPSPDNRSAIAVQVDAGTWSRLLAQARAEQRRCGFQIFAAAGPLRWNDALARAARAHSTDMAATGTLSHTGSRGQDLGQRLRSAGYRPQAWGENVAHGQPDAEAVMDAWLDSPGHCRNILDPAYREFGAAAARGEDGRRYWTLVLAAPVE